MKTDEKAADAEVRAEGPAEKTDPSLTSEEETIRPAAGAIFAHAESLDWTLNLAGAVAAIGSGIALALTELIFGNLTNLISGYSIGTLSKDAFLSGVNQETKYFCYAFIGRFVCSYIFTVCFTITGTRITRRIRCDFLKATLSQDISYFDKGQGQSVSQQVTTNGNTIQQGISEKLGLTIQACSACVAAIVIALIVQWKLTLITMTMVPLIVGIIGVAVSIDSKLETRILAVYEDAGALAEDIIASIRNVQAFWMRPRLLKKYDNFLGEAHRLGNKKSTIYGLFYCTEFFLIYCAFALCFWRGVHMYADGEIKGPGTVITVLFSVVLAASSLTQISPYAQAFVNAISSASALFVAIDTPSAINPLLSIGDVPPTIVGEVEFSGVGFRYPTRPDVQVLKDFSLLVPARKKTALCGPSGSGKSSCIALLERWYDAQVGCITIDGKPIELVNLKWLRTTMRLVQQEPVLFNGSVFDNVANGLVGTEWEAASPEIQMEHVIQACKIANAHGFVSALPEGYDTQVGERAHLLSGGQKQRIAIARAVVSDPAILLLDEATSALDPHSETEVQKALDQASINRTTIVIAHRLSTIMNADNIVVMTKGEIIEQGTHRRLLELGGSYARLVQAQDLEAKAEAKGDEEEMERLEDEEDENEKNLKHGSDVDETALQRATTISASQQKQQAQLDYENHKSRSILWTVFSTLKEQKHEWPMLLIVFVTCLAGGAIYPIQAIVLAKLTNVFNYTGHELISKGNFNSLMFFVFALGTMVVYFILGWCSNVVAQNLNHFYRREMFDSILKQDVQFFDRTESTTGALTSKLSSQPTNLQELWGFNLAMILIVIVNIIASSILGLAYGWKLGLVVVCGGLPLLVGSGYVRMTIDAKLNEDTGKRFADSAALASEAVSSIRTVSSLALEETVLKRYQEKVDRIVKVSLPSIIHAMFWFALSQSLEFLVLALGFWYGSQLIARGEYDMYRFFIVFVGVFLSGQGAGQFFMYTTSITKATSASNYIAWLRGLQPVVAESADNGENNPSTGVHDLALQDAHFSYPTRPATKVLRGISYNISPGHFVALVGGSGCGKSTIIGLLLRFYDTTSGSIRLDDTAINSLNPRTYRSELALVQQEPTLYQGTIRENISLGLQNSEEATDERILEACRQANIHDFITSLPSGLDTLCGTRGISLSGGQRQRIAIARALVRNPRILVLDEATSALDTENEKVVQNAILEAAKQGNRITVAVAHRLSTIKDADCILVLKDGVVVELGNHAELLARRGMYAEMCDAQSLEKL